MQGDVQAFKRCVTENALRQGPGGGFKHEDPEQRAILKYADGVLKKGEKAMYHYLRLDRPAEFTEDHESQPREIEARPLPAIVLPKPQQPPEPILPMPPRRSTRKSQPKAAYKETCDEAEDADDSDAVVDDPDSDGSPACAKRPRRGAPPGPRRKTPAGGECMPRRCLCFQCADLFCGSRGANWRLRCSYSMGRSMHVQQAGVGGPRAAAAMHGTLTCLNQTPLHYNCPTSRSASRCRWRRERTTLHAWTIPRYVDLS
jgi:hypothetical protein